MVITGTDGNDAFPLGLQGTDQADLIDGRAGSDWIYGNGGNDLLIGGLGSDLIYGGSGADTVSYAYAQEDIQVRLDDLTGNTLSGSETDLLSGIENVWGSGHADFITGDGSINELFGWGGNDGLFGGSGADRLSGGDGKDTLVGGAGGDRLVGGNGIDLADYNDSQSAIAVNLLSGSGFGGDAGGDLLDGIENVSGTAFGDFLTGNGAGNRLEGWLGGDTLSGGAGKDFLWGGAGKDDLTGGGGADRFHFETGDSAALKADADTIEDFNHAQGDKIDLSSLSGTFSFVGGADFSADNQVRATVSGGDTFVGVNTVGPSTAEMWIKLDGIHDLHANDFML